jgi:hypothetical protein
MLNTRYVADLIEKGEIGQIKEAMDKSLSPGSQSFERRCWNWCRRAGHAGRSAGECGFGDQPALAAQQRAGQPGRKGRAAEAGRAASGTRRSRNSRSTTKSLSQ